MTVDGDTVASIGPGLLVLLGVHVDDTPEEAVRLADKVAHLRVFADDEGKMNRSVLELGGAVLVVSQFTLHADTRRGRRPSFADAAPPETAEPLIDAVGARFRGLGIDLQMGAFGAHMQVALTNDGPVTIWLDTGI